MGKIRYGGRAQIFPNSLSTKDLRQNKVGNKYLYFLANKSAN